MKYRVLLYLLLILNIGFSQKEVSSFSIFQIISNSNPNFGPDEQMFNWTPSVINVTKSIRIDSTYGDTLILEYDNAGNIITYKTMNKWGRCNMFKYAYNRSNLLTNEISLDCDGTITYSLVKSYSDTSIIESEEGKNPSQIIYALDSKGNKTQRQDFINGSKSTYWIKEYDKNDNVTNFKFFWSDTLTFQEIYKYGTNKELIESEVQIKPYGLPTVYDFLGNPIVSFANENKRVYQYDTLNHQITEYRIKSNNDTIEYKYTYDQYGNLKVFTKTLDSKIKTIVHNEYRYDEFGNVIERKSYSNGVLNSLRKTKYEYKK